MRHRKTVVKLGRTAAHRKATLTNLAIALISKKHIQTTVAKAKATRQVVEKLITLAKNDTMHSRRLAFKKLNQKQVVQTLFDEIAPMFKDRTGGYTRVIKLGQRQGDGAQMAVIELVGFETAMKKKKEKDKNKETESKKKEKKKEKQAEEQNA